MGKITVDVSKLQKFRDNLKNLAEKELDSFFNETAKALAAEFIQLVKDRTPRDTGWLKRGWKIDSIEKVSDGYEVTIINPVEYASYVENGHRGVYVPTLGKTMHTDKRFTPGKFMMKTTEADIESLAPALVEKRFAAFLREVMK